MCVHGFEHDYFFDLKSLFTNSSWLIYVLLLNSSVLHKSEIELRWSDGLVEGFILKFPYCQVLFKDNYNF